MSERLPSIDGDISSGAVVFGNPEKKANMVINLVKKHIAEKNDDENVMHQAETENEAKASKTIEKEHVDEVVENGKPLRTRHRRVSSGPHFGL